MFAIHAKTNGEEDCTRVALHVKTDLPCEQSVIIFSFECDRQYAAQLLVDHIAREIRNSLEIIRQKAYTDGWKDAKGKQKKKREFGTNWNPDYIGY